MNSAPHHVIFGTGAIGLATLDALLRRGERVRLVNRGGSARVPDDVEVVAGDAADPAFTTTVTRGARVVYQTLNPPYARWLEEFPALQAGVLAAAEANGARMVSMENVYMYGRPAGQPFTETRAYAAHTRKGQLRARMARDLLAAHEAGRVEVAIGRASDYFGPRGGAQSNLGDRLFPAAIAGSTATVHRLADQPHSRLRQIQPLLVRLAALTNRTLRELLEMRYQFDEPFIVDSSKIAATLGVHATPIDRALAETLATYRTRDSRATAPSTRAQ